MQAIMCSCSILCSAGKDVICQNDTSSVVSQVHIYALRSMSEQHDGSMDISDTVMHAVKYAFTVGNLCICMLLLAVAALHHLSALTL